MILQVVVKMAIFIFPLSTTQSTEGHRPAPSTYHRFPKSLHQLVGSSPYTTTSVLQALPCNQQKSRIHQRLHHSKLIVGANECPKSSTTWSGISVPYFRLLYVYSKSHFTRHISKNNRKSNHHLRPCAAPLHDLLLRWLEKVSYKQNVHGSIWIYKHIDLSLQQVNNYRIIDGFNKFKKLCTPNWISSSSVKHKSYKTSLNNHHLR